MAGDLEADWGVIRHSGESHSLDIGEICFDWDIVNPWFQLWIEEFKPLITNMENKGTTQEEVFEPETCSYTSKIKQIPGKERAKYIQYYTPATTNRIFFFLFPPPHLSFYDPSPCLSYFQVSRTHLHVPVGFQGLLAVSGNVRWGEKRILSPDRPREGHKLGLDREM